jgi:hypothetical protein
MHPPFLCPSFLMPRCSVSRILSFVMNTTEHYLSTQQWASICIWATLHTPRLPLSRETFQTWTCSPAQVLIRFLLLSSTTQK